MVHKTIIIGTEFKVSPTMQTLIISISIFLYFISLEEHKVDCIIRIMRMQLLYKFFGLQNFSQSSVNLTMLDVEYQKDQKYFSHQLKYAFARLSRQSRKKPSVFSCVRT